MRTGAAATTGGRSATSAAAAAADARWWCTCGDAEWALRCADPGRAWPLAPLRTAGELVARAGAREGCPRRAVVGVRCSAGSAMTLGRRCGAPRRTLPPRTLPLSRPLLLAGLP